MRRKNIDLLVYHDRRDYNLKLTKKQLDEFATLAVNREGITDFYIYHCDKPELKYEPIGNLNHFLFKRLTKMTYTKKMSNYVRKVNNYLELEEKFEPVDELNIEEQVNYKRLLPKLRYAIKNLSKKEREAIRTHLRVDGTDREEAASINKNYETYRLNLRRAVKKLQEQFIKWEMLTV